MARVLVIEPFLGGSHAAFADGWARHSRHEVSVLDLPGRFWRWRLQGASVTLAERTPAHLERCGRPDLVVASDLIDLAGYLGATRRLLAEVPTALYLHEHQAAHPAGENETERVRDDRWAPMANWRSMHVADEVWCNSQHLLDGVAAGLERRLAEVPDESQVDLLESVLARCRILPVGVDLSRLRPEPSLEPESEPESEPERHVHPDGPLVVWNHRWEHDKGIGRFLRVAAALSTEGLAFRLALLGEDPHHDAHRFDPLLAPLADHIVVRGEQPRDEYEAWLRRSDIVVAAPHQENFGISVVEAIAAGAVPVVPDAFAYPEIVGDRALLHPPGHLRDALRDTLRDLPGARARCRGLAVAVRRFDWPQAAGLLDAGVDRLTGDR